MLIILDMEIFLAFCRVSVSTIAKKGTTRGIQKKLNDPTYTVLMLGNCPKILFSVSDVYTCPKPVPAITVVSHLVSHVYPITCNHQTLSAILQDVSVTPPYPRSQPVNSNINDPQQQA